MTINELNDILTRAQSFGALFIIIFVIGFWFLARHLQR